MAKAGASSALQMAKAKVQQALSAASTYLEAKQASTVQAFLQAPFTGTYTAQSGEVVGILKQMRDTFTENLEKATATEEASQAAYDKIMVEKKAEHEEMTTLLKEKQASQAAYDKIMVEKKAEHE